MNNRAAKQSGFTFIEIVSVMAASGFLAMLSLPMLNDYKAQSAASGVQKSFADALAQARAYAVAQGQSVEVCGSSDGKSCSSDAWSDGWLVYSGDRKMALGESISSDQIISAYHFEDASHTLHVIDEESKAVNEIRFDVQGFNLAQQRLAASVCLPSDNVEAGAVLVERNGRIRLTNRAAGDKTSAVAANSISGSAFNQCNQA